VYTLKYDEVYLNDYESPAQARACIGAFIQMYNGQRPHASLGGITPDMAYIRTGAQAAA
jgi:putative transposase